MRLGIAGTHIRRVSAIGAILAAILLTVGLAVGRRHGTIVTERQVLTLILSAAAIGAVLPLGVFLASVLQLEIVGQDVRQTLFGRWTVARRSLSDLVGIQLGGRAFPLLLTFRDGSQMRVLGAPLREVQEFVNTLQTRAPQAQLNA